MKTIVVPKNKCPLDVLAEMGEQIVNSWIFFNDDIIRKLEDSVTSAQMVNDEIITMYWCATQQYAETSLSIKSIHGMWFFCSEIKAEDISFTVPASKPDEVIFIEMEG